MDSSPVLRQQSQNKIQNDHSRMQNGFNKMTGDPTSSKYLSVPHLTKRGIENKDPAGSEKAPGRPGISRLPVLAKSLKLQAPTDFTQSHRRWDENPLSGKAKTKKQRTKPVPFNFSHPKAHGMVENQRPAVHPISRAGLQATQPVTSSTTDHTNPPGIVSATQRPNKFKSRVEHSPHVTPGQHLAALKARPSTLSQSNRGLCNGRKGPLKHQTTSAHISESQPQTFSKNCTVTGAGHPRHGQAPSTFDPMSVGLPTALSGLSKVLNCATASAQPAFTSESCLKHLNMLSLKELPKTLHDDPSLQSAASVQVLSGTAGSGEMFCPDLGAKHRILQNEQVSEGGAQGTPGSCQAWNFLPQRVSVMKSRQKNKPSAGLSRAVQFSPDPAALSSILQNEGVKAGGTLGATPSRSVCPSGRATSIYTAQRVPVTKSRAEASAGPMGLSRAVQFSPDPAALSSILQNEGVKAGGTLGATPSRSVCPSGRATSIYTAQRVPVTKSRAEASAGPMVMALNQTPARKWSPQRVPDTRHHSLSMRKLMSAHRTPHAGPPSLRGVQGHTKDKEEVVQQLFKETDQEEEEQAEEEIRDQETGAGQPPQQTCTTESSQTQSTAGQSRSLEDRQAEKSRERGQPSLQAPHRESVIFFSTGKLLLRSAPEQGTSAAASQQPPSVCPDSPSGSHTPSTSLPAGQSNQRRGVVQKAGALSSAAALLRRRLPPFEEMQLDGEVATYAHDPPSFCSLQRRCGDPVASYLHWQDYTSFVPVIDDPSGPAYSSPSPLWER
ncbi:uncharacterized protein LOC124480380 isoform X1 [Hypomesus transpacificus]|uniref:uncharacterized protein LOC124480380 isoform X1 n=1 Tax=Hypomesus transpacificus TaxID=137520 RepID=UPI001F083121|nr:uncharacterized protein LOC124480380 isoform X1 [Hypomesus transpacificus]XP_046895592.1 uncharacterized protein LOC124480380 isoform X1 [Hypomesus transpacificus]